MSPKKSPIWRHPPCLSPTAESAIISKQVETSFDSLWPVLKALSPCEFFLENGPSHTDKGSEIKYLVRLMAKW